MFSRRRSHGTQKPLPGVRASHAHIPGAASAWLFNETGGTTARDSIGNDHATLIGTTLTRSTGAGNGYGAISGYTSAAYLTTTRNTKSAYTLIARFKHGGGGYCNLFSAVGTAYQLHGWTAGQFNFWSSTEFGSGTNIGSTITSNKWITAAFVREGSSITGGYKLYYDGLLAGTANTGSLAAPTNPFWIGQRSDGFPQPWDGAIDYLMWFERAMNAAEIRQRFLDPFADWPRPGPKYIPLSAPVTPITGSASLTHGADSLSAVGTVGVAGASSQTQVANTASGAGVVAVGGSSAITQAADSSAAAGNVAVTSSSSAIQGANTTAGSGAVGVAGSAGITESGNTTTGVGGTIIGGSAGLTQAANSVAGSGATIVAGSAALVQDANAIASAGVVLVGGSGVAVQAGDGVVAAGVVSITATLSVVGSLNVVAATGITGSVTAPVACWFARPMPTAWLAKPITLIWRAVAVTTQWRANRTGLIWRATGMSELVENVLAKTPGDLNWRFGVNLSELPQVRAGATIASVVSVAASPVGLAIASTQVDTGNKSASATFSGGTADVDYAVTFTVTLSTGETVARTGTLKVRV